MTALLILAQSVSPHQDGLPPGVLVLMAVWILLGAGGWLLVWRAKTAERKIQIHRRLSIAAGIIFWLYKEICG